MVYLITVFMIVIVANVLSTFVFTRVDLTSEKRYSLSPATLNMLRNTDDVYFFRI